MVKLSRTRNSSFIYANSFVGFLSYARMCFLCGCFVFDNISISIRADRLLFNRISTKSRASYARSDRTSSSHICIAKSNLIRNCFYSHCNSQTRLLFFFLCVYFNSLSLSLCGMFNINVHSNANWNKFYVRAKHSGKKWAVYSKSHRHCNEKTALTTIIHIDSMGFLLLFCFSRLFTISK